MNRNFKTLSSLVLAIILILASTCMSFATYDAGSEISNVNQAYKLVRDAGFIAIYEAELYTKAGGTQDIYYVVCKGLDFTETDMSKPRSLANAIKIGLSSEDNSYVTTLVETVVNNCPADRPLVFVGHSMGGMVIQQAIANDQIKNKYDVLYSLAIGSPYIYTSGEKEGRLIRTVDNWDPIVYMSIPLLANPLVGEVKTESSMQFGLIHFNSYENGSCWAKYDALGIRKGGSTVTIGKCLFSDNQGGQLCFY